MESEAPAPDDGLSAFERRRPRLFGIAYRMLVTGDRRPRVLGHDSFAREGCDVAAAVARTAVGKPLNGTIEIGGPEALRFDEFIRRGLAARNDSRQVVADPRARYYGAELGERTLVPGDDARLGETRFDAWLSQSTSRGKVRSGHQRDAGQPSSSATPRA